mgnify:CR=1 FL=1
MPISTVSQKGLDAPLTLTAPTLTSPVISTITNGAATITLPTTTGTIALTSQLPVAGPAFSAYSSAGANISSSTWTKVTLDTETFDTNSNFASSRFTPTVAGYYQINFQIACSSSGNNAYWQWSSIYKNGSAYVSNTNVNGSGALQSFTWGTNQLIYMNGSTDYLEFYVNIYVASGTPSYGGGSAATVATGFLARAA